VTVLHLVTDSTSDLLPGDAERLGVTVVPLTVRFAEEQFRDGIDLDADSFYARLSRGGTTPTTSQPSPEAFAEVFRRLLRGPGDRVLSMHISSKLSGTLQSAALAGADLEGRVTTVDSGTVSMGIQLLLRAALRDLENGADVATVVRNTETRRGRLSVYVLLDTLTYLHRGGRIGAAQAFLGGVLNVRPLLRIVEGEVHPQARVRNRRQGIERMLALLAEAGPLESVGVMHSGAPELLDEVRPRLLGAYPELEVRTGQIGPVVGTYAGPRALGVACLRAERA
jgi:DegV family protein with EDD domain